MRLSFPAICVLLAFSLLSAASGGIPPTRLFADGLGGQAAPRTGTPEPPGARSPIPDPVVCPCGSAAVSEDRWITLDIECHSGTPPVLEFLLGDPRGRARGIRFDFESDGRVDLELGRVGEGVVFRGVPYREKGTYTLSAFIDKERGTLKKSFLISFVDFRWGRDNFSFANDGAFENSVDFVSKTVLDWVEDRFGEAWRGREALIRYLMYTLYKGSIGRCYGFTGLQMRCLEDPDAIPAPYRSVYDVRQGDEGIIRTMEWLQNDMVFANFLSGGRRLGGFAGIGVPEEGAASPADLEGELKTIMSSVMRGKPIIFGYVGNELHHAMVVYGFFRDLDRGKTTLLAANNWIREQRNNVYSEDAENVVIDLRDEFQPVTWFDLTKRKYRHIGRFFALGVRESYELDGRVLSALLERAESRIRENGRTIVMVENTEEAYVVDASGARSGYVNKKIVRDSETVLFKKIDYNYVFEVPAGDPATLVLNKRIFNKEKGVYKDVNLYAIVPGADGLRSAVAEGLRVPFLSPLSISMSRNGIAVEKAR